LDEFLKKKKHGSKVKVVGRLLIIFDITFYTL
jgi:hypothetical protein